MYPPRPLAHRQQNYTWDQGYVYQTDILPYSPSYPQSSLHQPTPSDLSSRVAALNRRAAIVSANLAHLTSVIKPLEHTKLDDLSERQLQDMEYEGAGLEHAMQEFRETMEEVGGLLAEIRGRKGWSIGGMASVSGGTGMSGGSAPMTSMRVTRGMREAGLGRYGGSRRSRSGLEF